MNEMALDEILKMLETPTADPYVSVPLEAWKLRLVAETLRSLVIRRESVADTDLFLARGLHLRLIANELRRMDILKTPGSHEALHTIGKVLEEILARPLDEALRRGDHKTFA